MLFSKALVLLRICRDDAIEILQKHNELGTFNEELDFELNNEQYYLLYQESNKEWREAYTPTYYGYYNKDYNDIVPYKKNILVQKKQIELGMILQCDGRDSFGILIGLFGDKLYYFDKTANFDMARFQIVSFILDENDPNKATYVIDIDRFEIVGNEDRTIKRPDGVYCSQTQWKAMQIGIPFIAMSRHLSCIYVPADNNERDIYYEAILRSPYVHVYDLRSYALALSFIPDIEVSDIKLEIRRLKQYINKFDLKKVINSYKVNKKGVFQRRVGRDDHFNIITTRTVDSKDSYVCSLLPIGEDLSYYDTSHEESNYDYIDELATMEGKENALALYDKEEHFSFLLKEYIDNHYDINKKCSDYNLKLKIMFNTEKIKSKIGFYFYSGGYKNVVARYNNNQPIN